MATGALLPMIRFSALNNGAAVPGAKLYSRLNATTTPSPLYTTAALNVAHTNPVVADAAGMFPAIYLAALNYEMQLTDSLGNVLIPWQQGIYDFGELMFSSSGGSALIGFIQSGTGAVARTAQSKMRDWVSVQDFGAVGDGVTDNTWAFTVAAAAHTNLFVPEGSYAFASTLNIPGTVGLLFATGAVLIPAAGVNLYLAGPVQAPPTQIFNTSASGSKVWFRPSPGAGGTLDAHTPHCYPDWWGGSKNVAPYDTAAVQAAFDSTITVLFNRSYYVTEVGLDFANNGVVVNGQSYSLLGAATATQDCILRIRGGSLNINSVEVDGQLNTNYRCGIHWYGDASNTNPEFNLLNKVQVANVLYGLVLGAVPGGAAPYNCPLSESTVTSFRGRNVMVSIYADQPNGKVVFNQPIPIPNIGPWAGNPAWHWDQSACVINIPYNESTGHGGAELIFNSPSFVSSDGTLDVYGKTAADGLGFSGGNINISNPILEVSGSNTINGPTINTPSFSSQQGGITVISGVRNGGGATSSARPFFDVSNGTYGQLILRDAAFNLPPGSANNPLSSFVRGNTSTLFRVDTKDCWFLEIPWSSNNSNNIDAPLVANCVLSMSNCRYTVENPSGIAIDTWVDCAGAANNPMVTFMDVNNPTTMDPTADQTTKNGWDYTGSANAGNFFQRATDAPGNTDYTRCIQLTSAAGDTATITSPTGSAGFPLAGGTVSRSRVLQGWMKTNNVSGTVTLNVNFWSFSGAASGVIVPMLGASVPGVYPAVRFNPTTTTDWQSWRRICALVPVPADCVYASLELSATNGAIVSIVGLSI